MLGSADEREGLAGQHGIGVARAGLDRDDLHVDVGLGEEVLGHGDIHRQVAGGMHRLRDQKLMLGGVRDVGLGDKGGAGRCGGAEEFASVHANLLLNY
jgi:hypothetical protein